MDGDWADYIVKRFFIGVAVILIGVFFLGRSCGSSEKKEEKKDWKLDKSLS